MSLPHDVMAAHGGSERLATQMFKLHLQSCVRVQNVLDLFRHAGLL